MIVSLILAMGERGQLGLDQKMPWHLPSEFKYFKELTMGHHLVMGRKTFQSIGRPLPGRTTIVLSKHSPEVLPLEVLVAHTPLEALSIARAARESEVFICGGEQIYKLYLPLAQKIYLSLVNYDGQADAWFDYPLGPEWALESDVFHDKDDKNILSWKAQIWRKK